MTGSDGVRFCHSLKSVSKSIEVENEGVLSPNSGRENDNIPLQHTLPLHNLTSKTSQDNKLNLQSDDRIG